MQIKKQDIMKKLKECYDPEIPVNIVDLGLIYDVKIDKNKVYVKMTLTTIGCPMHNFIVEDIRSKLMKLKGVKDIEVDIVWDPPWTPDRISKQARAQLGI